MIKVKDGYAKLIGTTYSGSADRVLLSNGGDKAVSDFAAASALGDYVTLATAQTITGVKNFASIIHINSGNSITDEGGNGVLGVKATTWTGVPSDGTAISLGTLNNSLYFRSSGDNMYHYRTDKSVAYKVLDASNYNYYSPTLTGGGASGTWGINITGSASSADIWDGKHFVKSYNEASDIDWSSLMWSANANCTDITSMSYAALMNVGTDLYRGWQIWNSRNDPRLYWRPAKGDASDWAEVRVLLDNYNYTTYLGYIGTTTVQSSSAAQALTGISRISNSTTANLYLGNSGNQGWVMTQDICSHSGSSSWAINVNGYSWFKQVNIGYTYTNTGDQAFNVKGNASITGDVIAGRVIIHDGTNSRLILKTASAGANASLSGYDTGGAYGADVVLNSGSALVLGAGESASTMYSNNVDSLQGSENLYLSADGYVKIFTNCDTIANRKQVAHFDTSGYAYFGSYINIGGHEKNASSPTYVWGSNDTDSFLRSYKTSSLSVKHASTSDYTNQAKSLEYKGLPSSTSNATNTVWCKFARITYNASAWCNAAGYFIFSGGESTDHAGILSYHFRAGSTATTNSIAVLEWLVKNRDTATVIAEKVDDNVYDLYINNYSTYTCPIVYHMTAQPDRFAWSVGSWTTTKPTAAYTSKDSGIVNYATTSSSSTTVGDGSVILIPQYNNEINFGGNYNSDRVYFGYRAAGSKPIPTSFVFGGASGSASITASKFIKSGGTSSQFLKADGSVDSNTYVTGGPYLPLSGGTITGNLIVDKTIQSNSGIIRPAATTANAVSAITFYKGSKSTDFKRDAVLGWYNEGGTNSNGALYLVPYPQDTDPWVGSIGLYISQTQLLFEGKTVYHSGNLTSLKNPNALTAFGVTYDGSSAQTVNEQTLINRLSNGTSDCTDSTIMLTSHTNGWSGNAGIIYGRPASKMYNYIKGKLDSVYLPLAGGTLSGHLSSNSGYTIVQPYGAQYNTTTSSVTGCITVVLPASIGNTMVSMWIDVYIYDKQKSFSVHCGGYTYNNSTWANHPFAMVYGANHRVRMGHNGTNFVIYIGEESTTWSYPQVSVRNVTLGYSSNIANWQQAWDVVFSTSVSNVTYDTTSYVWTTKNLTKSSIDLGNVQNTAFYKRSTYVNGTAWNMAGTTNSDAFTIYAPTTAGTSGQVLTSSGGTPSWTNQSSLSVGTAANADTVDNKHASDFKYVNVDNYSYMPNLAFYEGGSASTNYYKLSITNVNNVWTMLYVEMSIKENYSSGSYGKIVLHVNKNASNTISQFTIHTLGQLSSSVKAYANNTSSSFDIYIAGNWNWPTLNVDRITFGDSAASVTGKNITLTKVTALPSSYSTASVITGIHSSNYNSYAPKLDGTGATGTWGINITGSAASAGNANTVDSYHLESFGHYTNSSSVSNTSGSTWYAKVVLNLNWNSTTHYLYCNPGYNNINGWFILEIPSYTNNVGYIAKTSSYNGCNIQGFHYVRESDRITVYLKLEGNSAAQCTVYSTATIQSITSVSAPSYSFVSVSSQSFVTNYSITTRGDMYAAHFYENSDANLKKNIKAILDSDNIPVIKEFDWKSDGTHSYGLIAQELEEQGYSELVSDNGSHKTVNYSAALSLIVGKLQNKINELEKEIENLKLRN